MLRIDVVTLPHSLVRQQKNNLSKELFDKGRRQIYSFMIPQFAPVQAWLTAQEQNDSKYSGFQTHLQFYVSRIF